jgi:hypothetical protein
MMGRFIMSTNSNGRRIFDRVTLGVTSDLPFGERERGPYIEGLQQLDDPNKKSQLLVFDHLYGNLSVLDGKTNSLVQVSSVLSAIYVGTLGFVEAQDIDLGRTKVLGFDWPLIVGASSSLVAALFLLMVLRVHWSSPDDLVTEPTHARQLLARRDRRTIYYRIGWNLTYAAILILVYCVLAIALVRGT